MNGSQQALDLITRALIDPSDITLIEDPNYVGARDIFLAAGSQLLPVPVGPQGLEVQQFPAARRARLAYITPSHQFPTGCVMSLSARLALLSWAAEVGAYIIEDDYDSEFRYDGLHVSSVQSLNHDAPVIYVGTLSKTLSPALRIGYIVAPYALIHPLRTLKFLSDRHTSGLQQDVLTDFINHGHLERHVRRVGRRHEARRAALLAALQSEFGDSIAIEGANAGLHMLVWFNRLRFEQIDEMIQAAQKHRIGVYSIAPYYINRPAKAGLLFGFASLNETDIRSGIKLLARIFKEELPKFFS